MSISKSVGRCTLFALVVYLFVKGALIVVPRKMVGAVSALVAALVHACCGTDGAASMQRDELPVAVLATAPAPIRGLKRSVTVGECRGRPEDHEGAVNVPSQDQRVERAASGLSRHRRTRLMTEKWKELHFTEAELPRLAHALHATLVLVRERLVLLDRGIRDTLDPRHLVCEENEADDLTRDDQDIVLRAWSPKKEAERLRKDADRAEHRLQVLRERRHSKEPTR